jgi:hypothetical protein
LSIKNNAYLKTRGYSLLAAFDVAFPGTSSGILDYIGNAKNKVPTSLNISILYKYTTS